MKKSLANTVNNYLEESKTKELNQFEKRDAIVSYLLYYITEASEAISYYESQNKLSKDESKNLEGLYVTRGVFNQFLLNPEFRDSDTFFKKLHYITNEEEVSKNKVKSLKKK